MSPVLRYCLKVWLATLIIAPVLWLIIGWVLSTGVESFSSSPIWLVTQLGGYMIYMAVFGFIVSIPFFLLAFFLAVLLNKNLRNKHLFKPVLTIGGLVCSLIPLLIITFSGTALSAKLLAIYSSYPTVVIAGIWYFKFDTTVALLKTAASD